MADVWQGNEQQTLGPKKLADIQQDLSRIEEMLEYVRKNDQVEFGWAKAYLLPILHVDETIQIRENCSVGNAFKFLRLKLRTGQRRKIRFGMSLF